MTRANRCWVGRRTCRRRGGGRGGGGGGGDGGTDGRVRDGSVHVVRSVARGSRQTSRLMLVHAVILRRRGGSVPCRRAEKTLRRRRVAISTGYPCLLIRRTVRLSNAGRSALFHRRRPRARLLDHARGRWRHAGRLIDRVLRERCRRALGNIRMMVTRIVLGPLRDDRLRRLPIAGGLIARGVRRREHFRGGEGRPTDVTELLVHRAGGMWRLHRM